MKVFSIPSRTLNAVPLGRHSADKLLSLFIDPLRNKDVLLSITKKMEEEFANVIRGKRSVLKKTNTLIQNFPDGNEMGEFLGVHFDHGIINMAAIKVAGLKTLQTLHESVVVPEDERILRGTERLLFVVRTLKKFTRRMRELRIPDIGPVWNVGVNYGYLKVAARFGLASLHSLSWPDEYNFTGKPVRMRSLRKEIMTLADSIGFDLSVKGFIHTPEAVFLDAIWKYPETVGALSLDFRCTTCVKAETAEVKKLSYLDADKPYVLVKIFWESFGNGGEMKDILNRFDELVDSTSLKPGSNVFEKIVSEEYIVKLVRVVLLALAQDGHLFSSNVENKTRLEKYVRESTHGISSMSRSYSRGMWDHLMRTFRFSSLDVRETFIISRVVEVISWRASLVLAILISVCARYKHSKKSGKYSFLINGSYVKDEISDISSAVDFILGLFAEEKFSVDVKFSTQSEVIGAAILAAIYSKDPYYNDNDFQTV